MLSMSLAMMKASRIMAVLKGYVKDNLKIYFDFLSTRAKTLEFVGTGSCQFEGADDEIQIADHANLDGMDQLTVMCWFNYDSTCDNGGNLISKEHDDAYQLQVDTSNNRLQWFVNNASDSSTVSGISINTWHHVTCTYDSTGNGTGQMYIDGVLDQTDTTFSGSTIGANAHPLYLGGDSDSTVNFGGLMKNVGIWNRVLSASEIHNIMYKTYSDLKGTETTALLAWYPLETNGDDSTDSYDGTASGDITFHTSNYGGKGVRKPRGFDNADEAQADLIGSGSASFTGSNDDYITCGNSSDFVDDPDGAEVTIAAWFKGAAGADGTVFSKADDSNRAHQLYTHTDDKVIMKIGGTSISGASVVADSTWHHLVMVVRNDGGTYKGQLYVDGVEDATEASVGTATATGMDFLIGARRHDDNTDVGYTITGNIAQVGYWTAALTQEQIQSIKEKSYSELSTSEKTNLVSWWGLDVNADDEHGSNDGTLS